MVGSYGPKESFLKTVVIRSMLILTIGTHQGGEIVVPRTDHSSARAAFRFPQKVLIAFAFLARDYGFRCVRTEPTFVRYESPLAFVNVYHGRSSYELGLEVGRLGEDSEEEQGFTVMELMRLQDPQAEKDFSYFAATRPEQIQWAVTQLANLLKTYGGGALRGDECIFGRLYEERIRWREEFAKQTVLSQIRSRAEAAFRGKEYAKAAALYESIQTELTPLETKKLSYSRKHS